MKTKLLLIVLLAFAACKEETPTPDKPNPVNPVTPSTDYYVQVTSINPEHATIKIPRFAYFTDKEYVIESRKDTAWPASKINVQVFKDSIDLYLAGAFVNNYALNIYYKDSLLVSDTIGDLNYRDHVKWRL